MVYCLLMQLVTPVVLMLRLRVLSHLVVDAVDKRLSRLLLGHLHGVVQGSVGREQRLTKVMLPC